MASDNEVMAIPAPCQTGDARKKALCAAPLQGRILLSNVLSECRKIDMKNIVCNRKCTCLLAWKDHADKGCNAGNFCLTLGGLLSKV